MRWIEALAPASIFAMLASAVALYAVTEDTRRLLAEKRSINRTLATLEAKVAELTAERAVLMRPERIEVLTRRHLPLDLVTPQQLVAISQVPWQPEATAPPDGIGMPVP